MTNVQVQNIVKWVVVTPNYEKYAADFAGTYTSCIIIESPEVYINLCFG